MNQKTDETVVRGFSIPASRLARLQEEAEKQKRNLSNMLLIILDEHFARLDTATETPAPVGNGAGAGAKAAK